MEFVRDQSAPQLILILAGRRATEPRRALSGAPLPPAVGPAPKVSGEVRVATGAAYKPPLSATPCAAHLISGGAEFDLERSSRSLRALAASAWPRCGSTLAATVPGNDSRHPEPPGRVRGHDPVALRHHPADPPLPVAACSAAAAAAAAPTDSADCCHLLLPATMAELQVRPPPQADGRHRQGVR